MAKGPTGIRRKPNGKYLVQWQNPDGSRGTATAPDLETAKMVRAAKLHDAALARHGVISADDRAIGEAARRPLSEHLADWQAWMENKPRRGDDDAHVRRYYRMVKDCIAA